jgi:hypothetical protein
MWNKLIRWIGYLYALMMVLFLIGFYKTTPYLFQTFTFVVKIIMALFLLYRFNPYWKENRLTQLDRTIILYAAYFILLSSFTDYLNSIMIRLQKVISETSGDILHRVYLSNK